MTENPDRQAAPSTPAPIPAQVKRTRLGGIWLMLVLGAVVLVLLLVFILMNGQKVQIHLYGAHLNIPLGVGLLFAAALGVLLVVIPGGGRIIQLKRAARRLHKEREHLAGRLGEVTDATGTPPGAATGQQVENRDQYAGAPTAEERQAQPAGQAPGQAGYAPGQPGQAPDQAAAPTTVPVAGEQPIDAGKPQSQPYYGGQSSDDRQAAPQQQPSGRRWRRGGR
jgi:uncharacterized integral membrane protein